MSEQNRLCQFGRDGNAIHGNEWRFSPGAPKMNGASDKLFAGAAFSNHQHARFLELIQPSNLLDELAHWWAGPDQSCEAATRCLNVREGGQFVIRTLKCAFDLAAPF